MSVHSKRLHSIQKVSFSILLFGLIGLTLLSFTGYFSLHHWIADLCSQFRFQYLMLMTAGSIGLFFYRKKLALLFFMIGLINLIDILPLLIEVKNPAPTGHKIRITNINLYSQNQGTELPEI